MVLLTILCHTAAVKHSRAITAIIILRMKRGMFMMITVMLKALPVVNLAPIAVRGHAVQQLVPIDVQG